MKMRTTNEGHLFRQYIACVVLLFCAAGCANSLDRQSIKQFSRIGESMKASYSTATISNAIASWTKTLTNGYLLYDNDETRRKNIYLNSDSATLLMLRNGTNAVGLWGKSDCLPPDKSAYWADIIIRVTPVSDKNQISVAIHGSHFVRGLAWNMHTFGFNREKAVDLPPCPQDERQVLNAIISTLENTAK
jgi:hypothetical protein